ncbi:thioesterase domain-containing protein [Kutzneria albida]|uniref:Thioesterase domain-containing protein n=1 Tax=Kutzneria albida DSM 43870 TaxID=1449976 RepID=W5WCU3_9PSEU|nr:thioesterase domain-containing protein [Kutzneria albida]AHH98386.1 hypothetical protein KALB_5024 [Kutzneria albida DSM 43870]
MIRTLAECPSAPRVVLVHPGALPATVHQDLAAALGTLHVVDLEQLPAYRRMMVTGEQDGLSVAGLAESAAEQLRAAGLLHGPWLLAGWSVGGVVGYALTELLAEHQLPAHLVLLDSIAPARGYRRSREDFTAEVLLPWFVTYLAAKRGGRLSLPGKRFRGMDAETGLRLVLAAGIDSGLLWPDTTLAGLCKVYEVYLHGLFRNVGLTSAHRAGAARVPITLVRPENGLIDTADPLGWQRLATDLRVLRCPGDHYSMLRDPVTVALVARLTRQLLPTPMTARSA